MAHRIDPNKVIEKLAMRIAHEVLQNTMNEVALEEASATINALETAAAEGSGNVPNEG